MNKSQLGQVGPLQEYPIGDGTLKIMYRDIIHPDGPIRIEYYHDPDVDNPTAYIRFKERMRMFKAEAANWKTIVIDSVTTMELAARKYDEKVCNPIPVGRTKATLRKGDGVNPIQWYGASTDALEEMLCIQLVALHDINVVITCHINEKRNEVSGEILRGPFAPGRLADRKLLNAEYQEQYHAYATRQDGERIYQLQTQNDGNWAATTQIDAPNPCFPHYLSLWPNWPIERPAINLMVYGDYGVGKSSFASTFPKPMLVCIFDGKGKDIPYWRQMVL